MPMLTPHPRDGTGAGGEARPAPAAHAAPHSLPSMHDIEIARLLSEHGIAERVIRTAMKGRAPSRDDLAWLDGQVPHVMQRAAQRMRAVEERRTVQERAAAMAARDGRPVQSQASAAAIARRRRAIAVSCAAAALIAVALGWLFGSSWR